MGTLIKGGVDIMSDFSISTLLNNDLHLFFLIMSTTLTITISKNLVARSREKVTTGRAIFSAMITSGLIFSLSDWLRKWFDDKLFFLILILCGMVSIEIVKRISTLRGLRNLWDTWQEFKSFKDSNNTNNKRK